MHGYQDAPRQDPRIVDEAAEVEQHWEGLRLLRDALDGRSAVLQTALVSATKRFARTLDRAHATARWRDRHVTMPSMLQFRRHTTELLDEGDRLALAAQAYLRLLVGGECPTTGRAWPPRSPPWSTTKSSSSGFPRNSAQPSCC